MTTPNVALLRQTLAYIEAHPEEWNQAHWHCGTAACFAGRAALLAGGNWVNDKSSCVVVAPDDPPSDVFMVRGGEGHVLVEDRAKRVLGLTEEQADRLFAGGNNLDDLRSRVAELIGSGS